MILIFKDLRLVAKKCLVNGKYLPVITLGGLLTHKNLSKILIYIRKFWLAQEMLTIKVIRDGTFLIVPNLILFFS